LPGFDTSINNVTSLAEDFTEHLKGQKCNDGFMFLTEMLWWGIEKIIKGGS